MIKREKNRTEKYFKINRNILKLTIIFLLMLISFSSLVTASEENISDCGTISLSGNYVLNQSITSTGTCLTISADDVELNCNGNTIEYNTIGTSTRMGIDAISGTTPRTNLTIKNCILVKPTNLQTAGYGIRLTRFSNSSLINNTIFTNGTTNNYGIYLITDSKNNLIENNTIYSYGTSSGNYGIYAYSGSSETIIRNNNIYTYGTSANYGIYLRGTSSADANNNLIENNLISTDGTSTTNYGIYLLTNANNNTIKNNEINTYGSGTAHGTYISGVTTNSNNNNVLFNNISTNSTGASNYGVHLYRSVDNNNITGNIIQTSGTATNYGIYLIGTTGIEVDNNIISSNNIQTQGTTGGSNFGIYLSSNSNNNEVTNNLIQTNGSSTRNYGIQISGSSTLTTENNTIQSNNISTDGTTTNYGIYMLTNTNYNKIKNNIVSTSGTTSNYGIYVSGSTFEVKGNEISYNNIQANGTSETSSANPGIYLYRNVNFNEIFKNNITSEGTTSSYGIAMSGTTSLPVNNNLINENIIYTLARLTGNSYGIYGTTNINQNNLSNNNITTSGTTANYGIYLIGAANLESNNNTISTNNINTLGTTTNNYGIAITTNVNNNIIDKNNISTFGTSGNTGIYLAGSTTLSSENNIILENNIQTDGTSTTNYGIYLLTNAHNNIVMENEIKTNGSGSSYGIYLSGASSGVNNNNIASNNISTDSTGASNYGIYLYRNITYSNISDNKIKTSGTGNDFGIYLYGTSTLPVNSNLIKSNELRVTSANVIVVNLGSTNNTFESNSILERNDSYFDINILSAEENGTKFINQDFDSYNFGGTGEKISIKNANFGEITFSEKISGNGLNFGDLITISTNYVSVNSSAQQGLNKSAIISLYNLNYSQPIVLRDNEVCTDCFILSNEQGTVVFSVPHFSGYSIGENSALNIFDDSDINPSFGNTNFYANYTNITDNELILNANCTIYFEDISGIMTYNSSLNLYTFKRIISPGVHFYNVTCSTTNFATITATDSANIDTFEGLTQANITIINSERGNITTDPAFKLTQAGNVSQVSLDVTGLTKSWQGYFGSVGGSIYLRDSSNFTMYDWNITQPTGKIYASRSVGINFASIRCSDESEIISEESFIGHNSNDSDSVRNTFYKNTHPQFNVGTEIILANSCNSTNLYVNSSNQNSNFYEVLLSDDANSMIYTTLLENNNLGFNNQIYDFELLVGENGHDEEVTPYYFFVEIT